MRVSLLCLLITSLLGGCGEFSYKQGAGVRELDNVKQSCRAVDEASTEKCLETHGWFIHKFEDPNLSNTDDIDNTESANVRNTEPATIDVSAEKNQQSHVLISEPSESKDSQPTQIYRISSWWKMGASDSQLKMDLNQCSSIPANDEGANIAKQRYSKKLIHCMNKLGWKALGTSLGNSK